MTPSTSKLIMLGLSATATFAIITYGLREDLLTPAQNYDLNVIADSKPWEEYLKVFYYSMTCEEMQALHQIKTLNKFASNLLEKSENIDPIIVKIINDNFAELL